MRNCELLAIYVTVTHKVVSNNEKLCRIRVRHYEISTLENVTPLFFHLILVNGKTIELHFLMYYTLIDVSRWNQWPCAPTRLHPIFFFFFQYWVVARSVVVALFHQLLCELWLFKNINECLGVVTINAFWKVRSVMVRITAVTILMKTSGHVRTIFIYCSAGVVSFILQKQTISVQVSWLEIALLVRSNVQTIIASIWPWSAISGMIAAITRMKRNARSSAVLVCVPRSASRRSIKRSAVAPTATLCYPRIIGHVMRQVILLSVCKKHRRV